MTDTNDQIGIKLNLVNVTELIAEEYNDWKHGDFVIIESQTGTGKTYFIEMTLIKYLSRASILYVCNRKNLERQIKRDLLQLNGKDVPSSNEELDMIKEIGNSTIITYQAIQQRLLNNAYFKSEYWAAEDKKEYRYIILDECHYIFSDSNFNNVTRLAFDEFVHGLHIDSIKIFMTATTSEIKGPVLEYVERIRKATPYIGVEAGTDYKPRVYSSRMDYSYVNTKYFKYIEDIITTIQNDTSDDKWIVFVSNKEKDGQPMKERLGEDAAFITKDTDSNDPELVSIINTSRFSKKVLITTKTLDNGINIKDEKVKHIVIMAWDMITFIQMLGRRRVDIENADIVNLYIPMRDIRSFRTLHMVYKDKINEIELCLNDPIAFARKYDNSQRELGEKYNELFYIDRDTRNWTVNRLGEWRVQADKEFAEHMIQKFKDEGKFAFVREQLSWIGLEHTFDEKNLILDVVPNPVSDELENYLIDLYTTGKRMLMNKDRQELIARINERNKDGKLLNRITSLNSKLERIGSQYYIEKFETSRRVDGEKKNKKNAWRVAKRKEA